MGTKKITEKKFSMTVFVNDSFGQEGRDLLSQLIMEEIKQGADIIVDDVFESQNNDEYIVSGDVVSAKRMVRAIGDYFECEAVFKEI